MMVRGSAKQVLVDKDRGLSGLEKSAACQSVISSAHYYTHAHACMHIFTGTYVHGCMDIIRVT
jgi:hypothetical protein